LAQGPLKNQRVESRKLKSSKKEIDGAKALVLVVVEVVVVGFVEVLVDVVVVGVVVLVVDVPVVGVDVVAVVDVAVVVFDVVVVVDVAVVVFDVVVVVDAAVIGFVEVRTNVVDDVVVAPFVEVVTVGFAVEGEAPVVDKALVVDAFAVVVPVALKVEVRVRVVVEAAVVVAGVLDAIHHSPQPFNTSTLHTPEQHPSHGIAGNPGAPLHRPLTGVQVALPGPAGGARVVETGVEVAMHHSPQPFDTATLHTPEQHPSHGIAGNPGAPLQRPLTGVHV
jgi:hypothetical protein